MEDPPDGHRQTFERRARPGLREVADTDHESRLEAIDSSQDAFVEDR